MVTVNGGLIVHPQKDLRRSWPFHRLRWPVLVVLLVVGVVAVERGQLGIAACFAVAFAVGALIDGAPVQWFARRPSGRGGSESN